MAHSFTKQDIADMEAEIDRRKHELRPKLLEEVKEARAQGDLSDNFEYYASKREKNKNESRIRYLERLIRTSNIIEETAKEDEVGIGDTVTILFVEDGEEDKYQLVTTKNIDSLNNRISIESPIGKAIHGKKAGEKVMVQINKDTEFEIEIVKLEKGTD